MSIHWKVNHLATPKTEDQIISEWDRVALDRLHQIDSGLDFSFTDVLAPAVLECVEKESLKVLDIGCGTGTLSQKIANGTQEVVAIDPSAKSIELANQNHYSKNIEYIQTNAAQYADNNPNKNLYFDVIVANMVLMDVINLSSVLNPAYSLCGAGGTFCATITHPCFWPKYWSYENSGWFDYNEEIQIEAPFRITAGQLPSVTTHIHRPLSKYVDTVYEVGFGNVRIKELGGFNRFSDKGKQNKTKYPKFLMLTATKDPVS